MKNLCKGSVFFAVNKESEKKSLLASKKLVYICWFGNFFVHLQREKDVHYRMGRSPIATDLLFRL